jgi:hypothetical protein
VRLPVVAVDEEMLVAAKLVAIPVPVAKKLSFLNSLKMVCPLILMVMLESRSILTQTHFFVKICSKCLSLTRDMTDINNK